MVIKHVVMWKVRGDAPAEQALAVATVRRCFESLRGRIPGLVHLETGADTSRSEHACDVLLYSEFESQAALDAYARHPEHLRVQRELTGLRTERHHVDYPALERDTPRRDSDD